MHVFVFLLTLILSVTALLKFSDYLDKVRGDPKVPTFPILFLGLPTLIFFFIWVAHVLKEGFSWHGLIAVFAIPASLLASWLFVLLLFNFPDILAAVYKTIRNKKTYNKLKNENAASGTDARKDARPF